jgi:hypothetical protein
MPRPVHDQCMAHRTITISEEAYRRLRKNKRPGESFTEVILEVVPDSSETIGEAMQKGWELLNPGKPLPVRLKPATRRARHGNRS